MTHRKPLIYLIGPMGSGKSTIGRRVADLLGTEFLDCDSELEARTGASVNLIFDVEGEEGFRERETRLLEELAGGENCLVATGGGAVLREENRRIMKQSGVVVYLQTSVQKQLERLRQDRSRPLLQTANRERRLKEIAEVRNPLYLETADIVFPSQNRSVPLAAKRLSETLLSYWQQADESTESAPDERA